MGFKRSPFIGFTQVLVDRHTVRLAHAKQYVMAFFEMDRGGAKNNLYEKLTTDNAINRELNLIRLVCSEDVRNLSYAATYKMYLFTNM